MKVILSRMSHSIFGMIVIFLMLGVATFAWFAFYNNSTGDFILDVSNIDITYDFYVYQNDDYDGASTQSITNDLCASSEDNNCFLHIPNPTSAHIIDGSRKIVPSDRFSFALKVTNIGDISGRLMLVLTQIHSVGYGTIELNKIQTAFTYSISKITYIYQDIESADMKDSFDVIYAGMNETTSHFGIIDNGLYSLGSNIKVDATGNYQTVVIYFDLYFDPTIEGYDELLQPVGNSNPFQNQTFSLNQLIINLDPEY